MCLSRIFFAEPCPSAKGGRPTHSTLNQKSCLVYQLILNSLYFITAPSYCYTHNFADSSTLIICRLRELASRPEEYSPNTNLLLKQILINDVQGLVKRRSPGLVNFVIAFAYHFYLALPVAFTQPRAHLLAAEPC